MRTITFANQKGGVAKTTTVINLGSSLAELGKKVLIIDNDPQANMTEGVNFNTDKVDSTIYEVMVDKIPLDKAIYDTGIENLDIVPSDIRLANAELELASAFERETLLNRSMKESEKLKEYNYILIDCNPSLGLLTINALVAADETIIPIRPAMFSLIGIEQLVNVINMIQDSMNENLEIEGVLITQFDARTNLSKDFEEKIRKIFGEKIFNNLIHGNVKIAEAQAEQMPVNHYNKNARGAKEYLALAKELINNE